MAGIRIVKPELFRHEKLFEMAPIAVATGVHGLIPRRENDLQLVDKYPQVPSCTNSRESITKKVGGCHGKNPNRKIQTLSTREVI